MGDLMWLRLATYGGDMRNRCSLQSPGPQRVYNKTRRIAKVLWQGCGNCGLLLGMRNRSAQLCAADCANAAKSFRGGCATTERILGPRQMKATQRKPNPSARNIPRVNPSRPARAQIDPFQTYSKPGQTRGRLGKPSPIESTQAKQVQPNPPRQQTS